MHPFSVMVMSSEFVFVYSRYSVLQKNNIELIKIKVQFLDSSRRKFTAVFFVF